MLRIGAVASTPKHSIRPVITDLVWLFPLTDPPEI